jgi:amino acid transporter
MRDQDLEPKFSWPLAFFITGICFVVFFYILEKLNEAIPLIFLWIGIIAIVLAIISGISSLLMKLKQRSQQHQQIDK